MNVQGLTSPLVELSVPCLPEYVSVVRLAILGLCGRAALSYDEVEDLRLAVGEACASSVYRAGQVAMDDARLKVLASVEDSCIVLEIQDNVPLPPDTQLMDNPALDDNLDDQNFRASLIQLLVDDVEIGEISGGGQFVRLVKRCENTDED